MQRLNKMHHILHNVQRAYKGERSPCCPQSDSPTLTPSFDTLTSVYKLNFILLLSTDIRLCIKSRLQSRVPSPSLCCPSRQAPRLHHGQRRLRSKSRVAARPAARRRGAPPCSQTTTSRTPRAWSPGRGSSPSGIAAPRHWGLSVPRQSSLSQRASLSVGTRKRERGSARGPGEPRRAARPGQSSRHVASTAGAACSTPASFPAPSSG